MGFQFVPGCVAAAVSFRFRLGLLPFLFLFKCIWPSNVISASFWSHQHQTLFDVSNDFKYPGKRHVVRGCAIDMHLDISQEPPFTKKQECLGPAVDQDPDAHLVQARAIEMHLDSSQRDFSWNMTILYVTRVKWTNICEWLRWMWILCVYRCNFLL